MALETLRRVAAELVRAGTANQKKQLYQGLHPVYKGTTEHGFRLDRYTGTPSAMRAVKEGQTSIVRQFTPGKGEIFEPTINSEKTPIDQKLMGALLAGKESTQAIDQAAELIDEIINGETGFIAANNMQRNKATIDLLRLGIYQVTDEKDQTIQLDFGRDASLATTYDFTVSGATMDIALTAMLTLLDNFGFPKDNVGCIMGSDWLNEFEADTLILSKLAAYNGSFIYQIPENVQGIDGLYIIGRYKPAGSTTNITVMGYKPQWSYVINANAAAPFIPARECVMFNMGEAAKRIDCGIPVIDDKDNIIDVYGDLVITTDVQRDPATKYVIGKSRHAAFRFVNHTCKSYGTFS